MARATRQDSSFERVRPDRDKAFDQFVDDEGSTLRRIAFLATGDWAVADRCAEQALVGLYSSNVDPGDEPVALADVRRRLVEGVRGSVSTQAAGATHPGSDDDEEQRLMAALDTLEVDQRLIIALTWFARLPDLATADALGIESAAEPRKSALECLQQALAISGDTLVLPEQR